MMKPWQTSLNKTPNQGGKEGTKKEDPSRSWKDKTQSDLVRGIGTNHIPNFQSPFKKHIKNKMRNLKE